MADMPTHKTKHRINRTVIGVVLIVAVLWQPLFVVLPRLSFYFAPYYTDAVYKDLEQVFNVSQYRKKTHPVIIPDESLFSYASGAYLRGMDPILVNSEHTPLGKYMLAAFIAVFRNDRLPTLIFAFLTGLGIWLIGKILLRDAVFALVPLLFVSIDRLFLNQLITAPLLDIIQLPFVLFTMLAFLKENKHKRYPVTWFFIGVVAATKTVVPAVLLAGCAMMWLLVVKRRLNELLKFLAWLPAGAMVFLLSYVRTFQSGYSFWDFLGFQKWIFLYQKSKLLYPFSSLRLLFLNQWQTWWGDFSVVPVDDWSVLWAISTAISFACAGWLLSGKRWKKPLYKPLTFLVLWIVVYQSFLCLGVVSSRFFLPLLPVQYMVTVFVLERIWPYIKERILPFLVLGIIFFGTTHTVYAQYVLPYPSYMPGNALYRVSRIIDHIQYYWQWGDIARFKYFMAQSDKYLIEAKTLFEYGQHLLGVDALRRSDDAYNHIDVYLKYASANGKDISALSRLHVQQSIKHSEVLQKLLKELPQNFRWAPEKSAPLDLHLHEYIRLSMEIRQQATRSGQPL